MISLFHGLRDHVEHGSLLGRSNNVIWAVSDIAPLLRERMGSA